MGAAFAGYVRVLSPLFPRFLRVDEALGFLPKISTTVENTVENGA
jgi:hypothetical protein